MATLRSPQPSFDDPVNVDSKHYSVEFENEQVRVLRIRYGPREKSVMHYHPNSVAISLTNFRVRFTAEDGKSEEVTFRAGQPTWTDAGSHLPENLTDQVLEAVIVELKNA
jgi:quercetin dioxygenase-like cupin family protein